MNLGEYYRKYVVVELYNHKIFRGFVIEYIAPGENEEFPDESIIIRNERFENLIELFLHEIKSRKLQVQVGHPHDKICSA